MPEMRKIIRVFLASPGGLDEERRAAKEVVDEINKSLAKVFGCNVELVAWEETVSGFGRPQSIINKELETCELFVGILWKRWGTPPDKEKRFTSGFEEEFELSVARRKTTQEPEITLLFKDIDKELLRDPGSELQQVLNFKEKIASGREILFNKFADVRNFEKKFREIIIKFLLDLLSAEVDARNAKELAKSSKPIKESASISIEKSSVNPLSDEGHAFLKDFLEKTEAEGSENRVTSLEVARFRLLASSIPEVGNDRQVLGDHDANLMFSHGKDLKLGDKEVLELVACGLNKIEYGNVPLWHWYSVAEKILPDIFTFFTTLTFDVGKCAGALKAMRLIGKEIAIVPNSAMDRNYYLELWFLDDVDNDIKNEALKYLNEYGLSEDLPFIQAEFNKSDTGTSRLCGQAIQSILLRKDIKQAAETIIKENIDSVDSEVLEQIIPVLKDDDDLLRQGINHRVIEIRLACINELIATSKLSLAEGQDLVSDDNATIRHAALNFFLKDNPLFSDSDVREILVKPKQRAALGLFSFGAGYDREGLKYYDKFLFKKYLGKPEDFLLKKTENDSIYDDTAYFVLCEKYFEKYSEALRKNIDNQFKDYFENKITSEEEKIGVPSLIKTRELEESIRINLTRKGLDLLCRRGHEEDNKRVRNNLIKGFTQSSEDEVIYLGKFGQWEDIPYIIKARDNEAYSLSLLGSPDDNWKRIIAETVYKIGSSRLQELLENNIPERTLVELIKIISASNFAKLPDDTIFRLFNNSSNEIRKHSALKCIQVFKKAKLKKMLEVIVGSDKYRYYNVIHWLDFGVSLPHRISKNAIKRILKN